MATDQFGLELNEGDVVVQDRRKDATMLREVIEIDPSKPNQVRLGQAKASWGPTNMRPTWVETRKLTKYFDQGVFA